MAAPARAPPPLPAPAPAPAAAPAAAAAEAAFGGLPLPLLTAPPLPLPPPLPPLPPVRAIRALCTVWTVWYCWRNACVSLKSTDTSLASASAGTAAARHGSGIVRTTFADEPKASKTAKGEERVRGVGEDRVTKEGPWW